MNLYDFVMLGWIFNLCSIPVTAIIMLLCAFIVPDGQIKLKEIENKIENNSKTVYKILNLIVEIIFPFLMAVKYAISIYIIFGNKNIDKKVSILKSLKIFK